MARRAVLRASDADREQVAERLRRAATEGRLLPDEFEERLGVALSARTYGELDAVVADLPGGDLAPRRSSGGGLTRRPVAMVAVLVVVALIIAGVGAFAAGGHAHAGHGAGLGGGATLIWLVWIAVAWRFVLHRRGRAR